MYQNEAPPQKTMPIMYDLPIPYYQMTGNIMRQEAELFPEFASVIEAIKEPAWKLERKQQEV
ncbi:MAG: glycosyltransferase family 1 protein, partial [Dolichospermum sp.]